MPYDTSRSSHPALPGLPSNSPYYHHLRQGASEPGYFPHSTRDINEALAETLLARIGVGDTLSVCAWDLMDRNMSFQRLAAHYCGAKITDAMPMMVERALGTTDFGTDVVTALSAVAFASYDAAATNTLRLLRTILVPNFQAVRIGALGVSDLQLMPEHAEWPQGLLSVRGSLEAVAIETHALQLRITRQALINDEQQLLALTMQSLGNAAALTLSARLAAALENGDTLADGRTFFNTTDANILNGASLLGVVSHAAATTRLWRQATSSGSIVGIGPRFLVVPPELEADARALIVALYGSSSAAAGRLDIVICPHLSATSTWYYVADPAFAPTLALLTLGPLPSSRPLLIERAVPTIAIDGLALNVMLDARIARMSRVGIVKVVA